MNSRQLEYFLAVAHELNFTKAAESMYVSQTAVTQQIKALEEQLGVSLFERTKKKVVLTPAGKVFLQEASSILNRIDTAVERTREASSGVIGSLEIGFSVGIGNTGLAEKIQAFNEKYPNIAMKFTNQSPSMLLKMLKNGDLDLVLMPMFEERYYQNVEVRRLSTERMSAVFPRTHVLAQKPYVTRADLKDENLILACTPESEIGEDKRIILEAGISSECGGKDRGCGDDSSDAVSKYGGDDSAILSVDSIAVKRAACVSAIWRTGGYH